MIIFNESRIGGSRVIATYSKPRAFEVTLSLRYQVRGFCKFPPNTNPNPWKPLKSYTLSQIPSLGAPVFRTKASCVRLEQ